MYIVNRVETFTYQQSTLLYLTLSEGDGVEPGAREALVSSKLEQRHGGIGARRQDEDQRSAAVRVHERLGQVERRRLNEVLAELLSDEARDGWNNLHTASSSSSSTTVGSMPVGV